MKEAVSYMYKFIHRYLNRIHYVATYITKLNIILFLNSTTCFIQYIFLIIAQYFQKKKEFIKEFLLTKVT